MERLLPTRIIGLEAALFFYYLESPAYISEYDYSLQLTLFSVSTTFSSLFGFLSTVRLGFFGSFEGRLILHIFSLLFKIGSCLGDPLFDSSSLEVDSKPQNPLLTLIFVLFFLVFVFLDNG